MHFKTVKKPGVKRTATLANCSLCAQDIYSGERVWRRNGLTVCRDCFDTFAQGELKPFEMILGEEGEG